MADLDNDGDTEILIGWAAFTNDLVLRIYDGATGVLEHEKVSDSTENTAYDRYAMPAVGNLDADPELEIAVAAVCQNEMVVLEHDFTPKWSTAPNGSATPGCQTGAYAPKATLADLDADGSPEILIAMRGFDAAHSGIRVFDSAGTVVWERDDIPSAGTNESNITVADVDLDGEPEVSMGAALFSATGDIEWISTE